MSEDVTKVFAVRVINTEYLHVYAKDESRDSIIEAIYDCSFTHIETEDSRITDIFEIKNDSR